VRATLKYTLIRLGIFAIVLAVMLLIGAPWYFAAPVAAIAGLAVSFIFFRSIRNQMAIELATRGKRNARDEVIPEDDDTTAEDAVLDRLDDQRKAEK
jgi:hypothetical protein